MGKVQDIVLQHDYFQSDEWILSRDTGNVGEDLQKSPQDIFTLKVEFYPF